MKRDLKNIQRYDLIVVEYRGLSRQLDIGEDPTGKYVLYSDLCASLTTLQAEVKEMRELLKDIAKVYRTSKYEPGCGCLDCRIGKFAQEEAPNA